MLWRSYSECTVKLWAISNVCMWWSQSWCVYKVHIYISLVMIQDLEDVTSCRLANSYRRIWKIVMPWSSGSRWSNPTASPWPWIWYGATFQRIESFLSVPLWEPQISLLLCRIVCILLRKRKMKTFEIWKVKVKSLGVRYHITCRNAGKLDSLF
jgi:hypothetical protein